jgi:hypothetical protein
MVLNPLAEVSIGVFVAVVVSRRQEVMDLQHSDDRCDPQQGYEHRQRDSRSESPLEPCALREHVWDVSILKAVT